MGDVTRTFAIGLRHLIEKCTGDVTTRLPPVWQSPAVSAGPGGLCAVPWRRESVTQYDDG